LLDASSGSIAEIIRGGLAFHLYRLMLEEIELRKENRRLRKRLKQRRKRERRRLRRLQIE
jgi:regulator of replication initiation timing